MSAKCVRRHSRIVARQRLTPCTLGALPASPNLADFNRTLPVASPLIVARVSAARCPARWEFVPPTPEQGGPPDRVQGNVQPQTVFIGAGKCAPHPAQLPAARRPPSKALAPRTSCWPRSNGAGHRTVRLGPRRRGIWPGWPASPAAQTRILRACLEKPELSPRWVSTGHGQRVGALVTLTRTSRIVDVALHHESMNTGGAHRQNAHRRVAVDPRRHRHVVEHEPFRSSTPGSAGHRFPLRRLPACPTPG